MDLTTETDRQRLERALDAYPTDWGLRLLLADALEEAGEDVAAWGQRWQARCRVAPLNNPPLRLERAAWSWWQGDGWGFAEAAFRLRGGLFTLLTGSPVNAPPVYCGGHSTWRSYPTRAAAEADLARALSLLPDRGASLLPATC